MIQDIAPVRLQNSWVPGKNACTRDTMFCVSLQRTASGRQVPVFLVRDGQELSFPRLGELPFDSYAGFAGNDEPVFLFSLARADGQTEDFYLVGGLEAPQGFSYRTLREIRAERQEEQALFYALYTAAHLAIWYQHNRYCGSCGHETVASLAERARICPACKRVIYPQLIPAIIAGVIDPAADRILLTKYANRDVPYYALIAGFTEIGETLEECVEREVYEEVGLHIKNIRYYKSQPWGSVQDILAGFYCDVDGSTAIRRQEDELKEAVWVPRDAVELQPDDWSLTNEMMENFKKGRI